MEEAQRGFVKHAIRDGSDWDISTVPNGYFYGPLDLAIGTDDAPRISYHDHQDPSVFRPEKGDAIFAVLRDGAWQVDAIAHQGHDGWDNRITVDAQDGTHRRAIDPVDFGGRGVEYYGQQADGSWVVEQVSSNPISYKYATSIVVDPQGRPHITYFNEPRGELILASRGASGWTEQVIEERDAGLFSSLLIDDAGRFHVSYLQRTSNNAGTVKYATKDATDSDWEIREIDWLTALSFGTVGARNSTSLVVDVQGNPWVAYTDERDLTLAVWDGSDFQTSTVVSSGNRNLSQLVSMKLNQIGQPHLTYVEVTNTRPLQGNVKYAVGTPQRS